MGSLFSRVFGTLAGPPVSALTGQLQHVSFFVRIWRFGASKPEKFSGLAGATVTGVSLRKSQVKVIHLMGTSPLRCQEPSRERGTLRTLGVTGALIAWPADVSGEGE